MAWRCIVLSSICFIFCAGIALICVALASKSWVCAEPILRPKNSSNDVTTQNEGRLEPAANELLTNGQMEEPKIGGNLVYFGLFDGSRKLDYGSGARENFFTLRNEIKQGIGFMDLGAWITVILFAVLSLFWALIGAIFSVINILFEPVETMTGPIGLYLWSTLAMLCSFISIVVFIAQYFISMVHTVLLPDQIYVGWTSDQLTWFGYSFWLMVGSVGLFSLNALILLAAGIEVKSVNFNRGKGDANFDPAAFMY